MGEREDREEGREQGREGGKKRDGKRREGGRGRMVSKRETESSSKGFQEH